jgi:hypothetical protein
LPTIEENVDDVFAVSTNAGRMATVVFKHAKT